MPQGVVKTKEDEARWNKAKAIVEKEHGSAEGRWGLVMHIFKGMKKASEGTSPSRIVDLWLARQVVDRHLVAKKKYREQKGKKPALKQMTVQKIVKVDDDRWNEMTMEQKMAQVKRAYKGLRKALKKTPDNEQLKSIQSKLQKWVNTQVRKHLGKEVADKFFQQMESEGPSKAEVAKGVAKGLAGALKGLFGGIKNVSKKLMDELVKAPEATQKFFTDSKFRKEKTKAAAKTIREGAPALAKKWVKMALGEIKGQAEAVKLIARALPPKSEALTKEEKFTIYGASVYWAGFALATATGGLTTGADALAHSIMSHTNIRTLAKLSTDEKFLHTETVETIGGAGAALGDATIPFGTGNIPGWLHIKEFLSRIGSTVEDPYRHLFAAEDDEISDEDKEKVEKFMVKYFETLADTLENLGEDDIKSILQYPGSNK